MRAGFEFSAQPKPVKSQAKYRDPNSNRPSDYGRMSNDPRVQPNNPSNAGDYSNTKGSARSGGNRVEGSHREENNSQPMYAPLTERKIENEADLVPDYYVDRPPTPEYKPMEPGVEVATQVEDHELFDFRLEVEPILQVIVGKTLEQSQLELREEDEKILEARHKMLFEKVRNAELMVTQRKEAAHIRKQEEKARREKQYKIEKEDKAVAHRKYISRLLAKHVTFGIGGDSIRTLADQDVLNYNLKTEMSKEYLPVLIINALEQTNTYYTTEGVVRAIRQTVENQSSTRHAHHVKVEMDRRQKIIDDAEAERARQEAARKRRRERRRKLRIYVDKLALLEKIQATIVPKALEVEGPFATDITDVFPSGKESLATIGGLFGELWLILNTFNNEHPIDIRIEQLAQIFITILNDKPKSKDYNIYLNQEYQSLIQETLNIMNDDLISFNHSKHERIDEIAAQLEDLNFFQNLGILYHEKLLDQSIFNKLNKALLYLFFTSVEYKIPEKRPRKMTQGSVNEPAQTNEQQPETGETKPAEGEILGELHEEGKPKEVEEEEVKIPEVTPFEHAAVQAKKRLKLNFVADWDFRRDCDAVIRFRIPLVREVEPSKSDIKSETEKIEKAEQEEHIEKVEVKKEVKEKKIEKVPVKVEVVETPEERKERLRDLVENDDPIEPFDGGNFEKEKHEFREMDVTGHPLKIYNQSLVEGKYMAQINEVAQKKLRREIIELVKEAVPEWKEANDERILVKAEEKYRKYEKVVIDSLIEDPEQVAIYDIENI